LEKPLSRTIVGKFLALALGIAPSFYCAQSWAAPQQSFVRFLMESGAKGLETMSKEVEPIAKEVPIAKEKPQVSPENASEGAGVNSLEN
jgi:hypothetical protein